MDKELFWSSAFSLSKALSLHYVLINGHIPEQHFKNTVIALYLVSLIQTIWVHCEGRDKDKFKTKHGIKSCTALKREGCSFEVCFLRKN